MLRLGAHKGKTRHASTSLVSASVRPTHISPLKASDAAEPKIKERKVCVTYSGTNARAKGCDQAFGSHHTTSVLDKGAGVVSSHI